MSTDSDHSDLVDRMAKKHSVSPAAVGVVLEALRRGGGRMAQFSHADFGGMSQWLPGMSMVGAVGAQNDLRYAVFPETRRLAINDQGTITVYDTGNHRIFGVAQAQSSDQTLSFTSQDGLVRVADLQKVSG